MREARAHAEAPLATLASVLRRRRRNPQRHRRSPVKRATARMARRVHDPATAVVLGAGGAVAALAVARTVVAVIIRTACRRLFRSSAARSATRSTCTTQLRPAAGRARRRAGDAETTRQAIRRLAFLFGFGVGLIVDEFALLWNLNPDYYQPSSRFVAGLVLLGIVQVVYFRNLYLALGRRLLAMVRG